MTLTLRTPYPLLLSGLIALGLACSGADEVAQDDDARLAPQELAAPAACDARLTAGDLRGSLRHGGRERTYLLHVPASVRGDQRVPLVIDLHGYSRTAASQKTGSGWDKLVDQKGALAVYPQGIGNSWNVGGCCGTAGSENVDDVGFMRALIAKLVAESCVDPARVYVSGVSNGAGMTGRLGCELADAITGIALVSSDLRTQPCTPSRPVTEIAFRGLADTLEPYAGGLVGPPGGQYQSPGARGSFELYRQINQCTGTPTESVKYCETYGTCAAGSTVTLCSLPGVGHAPYTNNLGVNVAQVAWDAFNRPLCP